MGHKTFLSFVIDAPENYAEVFFHSYIGSLHQSGTYWGLYSFKLWFFLLKRPARAKHSSFINKKKVFDIDT